MASNAPYDPIQGSMDPDSDNVGVNDQAINKIIVDNNLSAKEFLSFQSYNDKKEDLVQKKADEYFMNNVLYYAPKETLDAFGMEKPSLSAELLAIANYQGAREFYTQYGKFWFPLFMSSSDNRYMVQYNSQIKKSILKNKLNELCSNSGLVYAEQNCLIYSEAFKETFPKAKYYIEIGDYAITMVRKYLLDDNNLANWVKDINGTQDEKEAFRKFHALKGQLDFLGGFSKTISQDILGIYASALYFEYASRNIDNSAYNQALVEKIVKEIFEGIDKKGKDWMKEGIKSMSAATGGTAGALTSCIKLVKDLSFKNDLSPTDPAWQQKLVTAVNKHYPNVKGIQEVQRLCNSIFRSFQILVLCIGFTSLDEQNAALKGVYALDVVTTFMDIATMNPTANTKMTEFFSKVGKWVFLKIPSDVRGFTNFSAIAAKIFGVDAKQFVGTRLAPILMFITACISLKDCVLNTMDGNYGAAVLDGISSIIGFIGASSIFWLSAAFTGPFALVCSGLILGLALIKYFWFTKSQPELILEYFNSLPDQFKKPAGSADSKK